ncbi:MAG: ABC transporter permease [Planctomycetota bacterium]
MSAKNFLGQVGQEIANWGKRWILAPLNEAGQTVFLCIETILHGRSLWEKKDEFFRQLRICAIGGLPVTTLVAAFSGMIFAYQVALGLKELALERMVGILVMQGMCRETAPVMTGITLSGLIASRMAAEIGAMRVSEELDALEVMSISPVKYLIMPRVFAMILAAPALTLLADVAGIWAGGVITSMKFDVDPTLYYGEGREYLQNKDIWGGLVKSGVFGVLVSVVGCRQGMRAAGGASGVGIATMRAVVISSVFVVVLDLVLNMRIWPD